MNAQLKTKIVFWYDGTTGEIRMGLPEQFPAPANDETLAVRIDDDDFDGADWYEIVISW